MNDKEIEALIREEFNAVTPRNFDSILEKIQTEQETAKKQKRPGRRKSVSNMVKVAWVAILLLVFGTGMVGYRSTTIPTDVIQIDVNPSIAIEVNRYGDVVACQGLGNKAKKMLKKQKFCADTAEQMVRSTVLSLIDDGYISKKDNAILISVIGNSPKRTEKLEQLAVNAAVSTQKDSGIKLKVYKQHLKEQGNLKELAEQYGISEGKAAFIQTIAEAVPETALETLSTMSMSELSSTVTDYLGGSSTGVEDVTPIEGGTVLPATATPSPTKSAAPVTVEPTKTPTVTVAPTTSATTSPSASVTTSPTTSVSPTPTSSAEPTETEDPVTPTPTATATPTASTSPTVEPTESAEQ